MRSIFEFIVGSLLFIEKIGAKAQQACILHISFPGLNNTKEASHKDFPLFVST